MDALSADAFFDFDSFQDNGMRIRDPTTASHPSNNPLGSILQPSNFNAGETLLLARDRERERRRKTTNNLSNESKGQVRRERDEKRKERDQFIRRFHREIDSRIEEYTSTYGVSDIRARQELLRTSKYSRDTGSNKRAAWIFVTSLLINESTFFLYSLMF